MEMNPIYSIENNKVVISAEIQSSELSAKDKAKLKSFFNNGSFNEVLNSTGDKINNIPLKYEGVEVFQQNVLKSLYAMQNNFELSTNTALESGVKIDENYFKSEYSRFENGLLALNSKMENLAFPSEQKMNSFESSVSNIAKGLFKDIEQAFPGLKLDGLSMYERLSAYENMAKKTTKKDHDDHQHKINHTSNLNLAM